MRNAVPKIGLAAAALFFAYAWYRASMSSAPADELGFFGGVILFATVILTLATMAIAARRAYDASSKLWLFAVIFVWPLSYLYALAINKGK